MKEDDEDFRSQWGFPVHGPMTRPGAVVHSGSRDSNTKIEQNTDNSINKPLPWIALAMLIAGVSIVMALWSRTEASKAERETRMLEYYLLELDARVIAAGIKKPDESIAQKLDKERK